MQRQPNWGNIIQQVAATSDVDVAVVVAVVALCSLPNCSYL